MKRNITGKNTAIRSKLSSDAGASITFALLLFLVCAMVSAVVLVAATTAAGRMASIAEADQRYFAVTSAAELIKDSVSEKTVTVMTIGDKTVSIVKPANAVTAEDINKANAGVSAPEDNYIVTEKSDTYVHVQRPATKSGTTSTDALVKKLSELVLEKLSGLNQPGVTKTEDSFSFTLDVNGNKDLEVKVDATVDKKGNTAFVVYNTKGKPFKMTMDFTADAERGLTPSIAGADIVSSDETGEISWHLERVITTYDASVVDAENRG